MQRKLWIGIGVLGVLLIYVLLTQTGNRGFNTLQLPKLPVITVDQMSKIQLDQPSGRLVLALLDKKWRLVEPLDFAADTSKLDNARRALSEVRITDIIAEQPESYVDYGLNSGTAVRIGVQSLKDKKFDLFVGRVNPAGTHTFVRLPDKPAVYQVLGDLAAPLAFPAKAWRSLQIFDLSTDDIREADITQSGKTLTFRKVEEPQPGIVPNSPQGVTPPALPSRTIWKADGQAQPLDETKVNQMLGALARLNGTAIVDDPAPAGKPLATVRFRTLQGEQALEFLSLNASNRRYLVRRAGDPVVYELEEYQGKNLLKSYADLK